MRQDSGANLIVDYNVIKQDAADYEAQAENALQKQGAMSPAELKTALKKYKNILELEVTDKETDATVHQAYREVHGIRMDITAKGKAAREDAIAYQRAVVAAEKSLIGIVKPVEEQLKSNRDEYRADQARIRKEKRERAAKVQSEIDRLKNYPARTVGQSAEGIRFEISQLERTKIHEIWKQWEGERLQEAEKAKADSLEAMNKALSEREDYEKQAAELEALRQAKEAAEQARREAEAAKAKAEQQAREAKLKAEREKAEASRKAAEEKARKLQEAERKRKAEAAAKLKAEQEAAAQKAAEEKRAAEEKAEAERLEALRPDQEKITQFAADLHQWAQQNQPEVSDKKAAMLLAGAVKAVGNIANQLNKQAEQL